MVAGHVTRLLIEQIPASDSKYTASPASTDWMEILMQVSRHVARAATPLVAAGLIFGAAGAAGASAPPLGSTKCGQVLVGSGSNLTLENHLFKVVGYKGKAKTPVYKDMGENKKACPQGRRLAQS
jgi:hypothetical protein